MGARIRITLAFLRDPPPPQSLVYGEIDFWSFYDVVRVAVDGIDADQHDTNNAEAPPAAAVENTNGRHRIQHGIGDRGENRPDSSDGGGGTRRPIKEANGQREHWSKRAVEAEAEAAMGGGGGKERGLKFYDLGSGSGRAIFAAVLAVDFR